MEKKAVFMLAVMGSGILLPLGLVWEQTHPPYETCPPCSAGLPLPAWTCGGPPPPNVRCPDCGRYWFSWTAPHRRPSETVMNAVIPWWEPTVFNSPEQGVFPSHLIDEFWQSRQ